jgi:hypothetical protein
MLGGAWWMPTAVLAMVSGASRAGCTIILGAEANRHSMEHPAGLVGLARRYIFGRADAFLVPGRIAEETVRDGPQWSDQALPRVAEHGRRAEVWLQSGTSCVPRAGKLRARWEVADADRVLVWSARLDEPSRVSSSF